MVNISSEYRVVRTKNMSGQSSRKKMEQELGDIIPSPPLPQVFNEHLAITRRLKKTLYYGKENDRLNLSLTSLAVECYSGLEDGLDRLDLDLASELSRNAGISPCSLLLGMTYLGRLNKYNPGYLTTVSSSQLFLVSVMVASKFLYDDGEEDDISNYTWSQAAGMDVKEMNKLERDFLMAINWNVFVRFDEYFELLSVIEQRIAIDEGLNRGWFSYTDLSVLSMKADPWELYQLLIQTVSTCVAIYTTGLLTVCGTAAIISQALPLSLQAGSACSAALNHVTTAGLSAHYAVLDALMSKDKLEEENETLPCNIDLSNLDLEVVRHSAKQPFDSFTFSFFRNVASISWWLRNETAICQQISMPLLANG